MLVNQTVKQFVDSVASDAPAPGGGSVSALAGALAAGLVAMVCNLTIGRPKFAEAEGELKQLLDRSSTLQAELLKLVDQDAESFNQVMAAYRLPKEADEDKLKRSTAIQTATKSAAAVPLKVAGNCFDLLKMIPVLTEKGNPNAITDIGVAARMAEAGLQGAVYNVLINLGSLKDETFVAEAKALSDKYITESREIAAKTHQTTNAAVSN